MPAQASDIGFSISVGQPGFYGRIDVGGYPRPALIYSQPVYIERSAYGRPPIYLRVPPGHAKHWERHCHEYHACGERVYFVRDDWYEQQYVPRYREHHGHEHRRDWGDERREERYERRNDDREDRHERGHGRGHGRDRDR